MLSTQYNSITIVQLLALCVPMSIPRLQLWMPLESLGWPEYPWHVSLSNNISSSLALNFKPSCPRLALQYQDFLSTTWGSPQPNFHYATQACLYRNAQSVYRWIYVLDINPVPGIHWESWKERTGWKIRQKVWYPGTQVLRLLQDQNVSHLSVGESF